LGFTVLAGILMLVAFLIYAAFRLEMPIGITCQLPPCY
jgi:HAMP domain-containing protein